MEIIDKLIFQGCVLDVYGSLEEPLFLAVDVARMIGYSENRASEMISQVDDREKLTSIVSRADQGRRAWFLTEDGLYEVLMQSRKPIAKKFKRSIKHILKNLRREKNQNMPEWFKSLDDIAELEALNDLREDMNLPPLTMEEFMANNKE